MLQALGTNLLGIANGTVNGTLGIANTTINKSTKLAESVIGNTLQTAIDVQSSAQQVIQETVKTSAQITKETLHATGKVSTAALDVVSVNATNAASIINTSSNEGKAITNEAIEQSGRLAKTSLSLAGTSLYNLLGTLDNVALSHSKKVKASNEMTNAMFSETLITMLKKEIQQLFRTRMNDLIHSLRSYSNTQKSFIQQSLSVYKTMHCTRGKLWGHQCSQDHELTVQRFEKKLRVVLDRSNTKLEQLKGIENEIDVVLVGEYAKKTTIAEYKEAALHDISPYYKKSTELYTDIIEHFKNLTEELENEMNKELKHTLVTGGIRRRKRPTKKRKLMRPRFRSRRTRWIS
jgi:hypothetical protein